MRNKYTHIILIIALLLFSAEARAQKFKVDTLQYQGDASKYLNLVVLGDGYVNTEQDSFRAQAKRLVKYYLGQQPWKHYSSYVNVFAVEVISKESGVKHPNNASDCSTDPFPTGNPNNYFGSSFDAFGIHRLVVASNTSAITGVLASNMPSYDIVLILANSVHYGGSGGQFAVATVNGASNEIACHETGHSFGGLADEYWAGIQYAAEKPNMTQETSLSKIKWHNWLINSTGIGINQYPGYPWYHPSNTCKMEYLGYPFCSVCSQAIVEQIHNMVSPLLSYTPDSAKVQATGRTVHFRLNTIHPTPNSLSVMWYLDGTKTADAGDSASLSWKTLSIGDHQFKAAVTDTTSLIRDSAHTAGYSTVVSWVVHESETGISLLQTSQAHISYEVYPNPVTDALHVKTRLEKEAMTAYYIFNEEGKEVFFIKPQKVPSGDMEQIISMSGLPPGSYFIVLNMDGVEYTSKFMKH